MNHYRDPLAGLRSQIATKRALADEHERALSPVLRALLPAELRQAMQDLPARDEEVGESMEELSAAESMLDARLVLYDEALRLAPSLRECEAAVPDPPSPRIPPPWLFHEQYQLRVRDRVNARLLQVHPDAQLSRWGDFGYIARFSVGEIPLIFLVNCEVMADTELVARYLCSVRTTVPEGLAALDVSRERIAHVIGRALRVVREHQVGVLPFDDRFWITGSWSTTALLTSEVRAALTRLADQSPILHIGGGIALLTWSGHWKRLLSDGLPDAALDVLVEIRAAIAHG